MGRRQRLLTAGKRARDGVLDARERLIDRERLCHVLSERSTDIVLGQTVNEDSEV